MRSALYKEITDTRKRVAKKKKGKKIMKKERDEKVKEGREEENQYIRQEHNTRKGKGERKKKI